MAGTSRIGQTSWVGGWSNRATASLGFTFGAPLGSGTEHKMKKDNDDEEEEGIEIVEKVPLDMTEDLDDVQVIKFDPLDETDQTA